MGSKNKNLKEHDLISRIANKEISIHDLLIGKGEVEAVAEIDIEDTKDKEEITLSKVIENREHSLHSESYFDGSVIGLIMLNIACMFLNIITLGIAHPYTTCMKLIWEKGHTVVNGKRLKFIGTGSSLAFNMLRWKMINMLSFGLYSLTLDIKLREWTVKNTVIDFD